MTKTESESPKAQNRIVWIVLAIVTIAVYFFALGSIPLLGPDEPRYAQVAREMFERGDWVTPTLGGYTWFEKPALLYWLQIVFYHIFGVSEFSARFGSAIFGLLTIFSLWLLGKFVESNKNSQFSPHRSQLKNWLFLISATSIGLLAFSRGASFDIILTFPVTASLVGFFIFDQATKKSFINYHLPLIAFYFFIGVALLAKGLVGIVFPLAIVSFYYVLTRKIPSKTFIASLFWGTALSLAVAATWYVPVYWKNGWTFVDEFFIQHHFARYVSNKYQHPQPFWFFFLVLPLMTLPWLPFFLTAIWKEVKVQSSKFKAQSVKALGTEDSALTTFAFAWLLVPLIFFSFSGSKLPGYILPALPAALILTADYVSRFAGNNRKRENGLQITAFVMLLITFIALQFFVKNYARSETVKELIATANTGGFSNSKILNMHSVSHSEEFYAAGRLVRTDDGKIKIFYGAAELAEEIRRENAENVLILVPLEYADQLQENASLRSEKLADNGDLAIFAASLQK